MPDEYPKELSFCYWGNPILRERTVEIEDPESKELREFIRKMRAKLEEHNGLGLAANQVNCNRRICLVTFLKNNEFSDTRVLINPEIIEKSEESEVSEEGCLSFPELYKNISRPKKIKVKAYIPGEGETVFEVEDITARVICHEVDHLNGIVFIDHLSQTQRSLIKKELKRIAKEYNK